MSFVRSTETVAQKRLLFHDVLETYRADTVARDKQRSFVGRVVHIFSYDSKPKEKYLFATFASRRSQPLLFLSLRRDLTFRTDQCRCHGLYDLLQAMPDPCARWRGSFCPRRLCVQRPVDRRNKEIKGKALHDEGAPVSITTPSRNSHTDKEVRSPQNARTLST